jgi:ADP-ribose pyrophosphatase YjhB (NUDIX family)
MSKIVICKDVQGKEYEVPAEELKWRPAAYGVVIKGGKILLSKQFGDKYDLPGGGVDPGEKLEDGVIREVKEETGIDVNNPKLLGFVESFFMDSHALNEAYHCYLFYYLCEYVGGKLSTDGFDEWEKQYAEMAEWIDIKEADILKLASTVDYRPFIKRALKEQ